MSATLPILESIKDRLYKHIDKCAVELFPDDLENYYVKDEYGAILIGYAGSKFESLNSVDIIQQRRAVHIALTVIARSQHNDYGALDLLDKIRLAIVGFKPTNCTACHLVNEEFAGEDQGLWQYQLIVKTETWQVEDKQAADLPKFVQGLYRRKYQQKK
ncbi:Gp37 family protein [Actinobacillus equuli]|uniref:Gp37 family protein n=1 Tax=Actinobacillus equuli TaxID=718 RepID=UPI0024417276|nr:Gp37 family protein [Actinobacillus equuli]WGE52379.1 Gp37 family protein [Actinobacillus equuli subsp. haemolyticus]